MNMIAILLTCCLLFASTIGAPRFGNGPSLPRLPLDVLLKGQRPQYDEQDNNSKIIGGEVVEPNSLPFQVSLQLRSNGVHYCGGIIYNERIVISAAHCVYGFNPSAFRIAAGEHDLNEISGLEQFVDVQEYIPHENFEPSLLLNDISLITLSRSLNLSVPSAQPIKLPRPMKQTPAGTRLFTSGWGTTSLDGPISYQLRKVMVPAVSDEDCRAVYGSERMLDYMVCAGVPQGGIDSCYGDSGGPLFSVLDGDVPDELIGIVSGGEDCALPGYPGIYTEVSYFIDWIEENSIRPIV